MRPRPAFTLIELMVVAGMIILLVALSMPAIGPMLKSNQMAQVMNTLNGLLTTTQTAAEANATPVAIRIERAFKVNDQGLMVDAQGRTTRVDDPTFKPVWLDHQQARYVIYGTMQRNYAGAVFTRMSGAATVALPKGAWLAPDFAIGSNFNLPDYTTPRTPSKGPDPEPQGVDLNFFENFYVVFDQTGAITQFPADRLIYYDVSQPNSSDQYPYPGYPDNNEYLKHNPPRYPSARGLLVYDRNEFTGLTSDTDRLTYLQTKARAAYINRSIGSLVEGSKP